ncbi:MAG: GGDEF domain-containing protein [Sphingobium sp.]
MQFYLATSFIFPQSLRLRLFALCALAMYCPLVPFLAWGMMSGRLGAAEFLLLSIMAFAGGLIALAGIGALLQPIHALADRLHPAVPGEAPPSLPELGDVIRTLYAGVHHAATTAQARISDLDIAAHEDALTGVANRRGFLAEMECLAKERRHGCIAIVDLDHFKLVNDRLGHAEGDRVLREVAARLSAQLRRADLLARWGGEEFVIFFRDCITDEACWSLARIAERMRRDPVAHLDDRPVTFSAGICRWAGEPLDEVLRAADDALYDAKRAGRDQLRRAHVGQDQWAMVGT